MGTDTLIVKIAAIGDVVMALPMVSALRELHPQGRIAWLCGRTAAPLVRSVEGIDECLTLDDRALFAGPVAQAKSVLAIQSRLAGRRFDRVLVAHADPRYRLLARSIRSKDRRWLGATTETRAPARYRTHTDEYVRLATGIDDHRARRYPFPPIRTVLPPALAARLGAPQNEHWIALAPGGAKNAARDDPLRRWPLASYAELARMLVEGGWRVLITGTASDAWAREAFAKLTVEDLIGATDLPALVALYRRCAAVVSHDSGPLHVARLAGVPALGLFGPTPPALFVRDEREIAVLWPGASLPCAPCYDGRNYAACDDNVCMKMITPSMAFARLAALLERERA
jgi:heptosyltransferase-2